MNKTISMDPILLATCTLIIVELRNKAPVIVFVAE